MFGCLGASVCVWWLGDNSRIEPKITLLWPSFRIDGTSTWCEIEIEQCNMKWHGNGIFRNGLPEWTKKKNERRKTPQIGMINCSYRRTQTQSFRSLERRPSQNVDICYFMQRINTNWWIFRFNWRTFHEFIEYIEANRFFFFIFILSSSSSGAVHVHY